MRRKLNIRRWLGPISLLLLFLFNLPIATAATPYVPKYEPPQYRPEIVPPDWEQLDMGQTPEDAANEQSTWKKPDIDELKELLMNEEELQSPSFWAKLLELIRSKEGAFVIGGSLVALLIAGGIAVKQGAFSAGSSGIGSLFASGKIFSSLFSNGGVFSKATSATLFGSIRAGFAALGAALGWSHFKQLWSNHKGMLTSAALALGILTGGGYYWYQENAGVKGYDPVAAAQRYQYYQLSKMEDSQTYIKLKYGDQLRGYYRDADGVLRDSNGKIAWDFIEQYRERNPSLYGTLLYPMYVNLMDREYSLDHAEEYQTFWETYVAMYLRPDLDRNTFGTLNEVERKKRLAELDHILTFEKKKLEAYRFMYENFGDHGVPLYVMSHLTEFDPSLNPVEIPFPNLTLPAKALSWGERAVAKGKEVIGKTKSAQPTGGTVGTKPATGLDDAVAHNGSGGGSQQNGTLPKNLAECNCFTAGTKVLTDVGEKNIEDIEVGDKVLAKDDLTGEMAYKAVEWLYQRDVEVTYNISVGSEVITTTDEHPFWIVGRGWVEAKHLEVSDVLTTSDGKKVAIEKIVVKEEHKTVYNFKVKDFHTYFVSNLGIWTHNKCGDIPGGTGKTNPIKVEFHERYSESHIIKGDGIKRTGVSGAHNMNHFNETLQKTGANIDDLIIGEPIQHPNFPGLYEIKYRVPAMTYGPGGKLVPTGQFREIKDPKTVYDPKVYSDEQIIQWGKEAMQEGLESNRVTGRVIVGYAPNGMRFTGYVDDGQITNFFPSFD
ncbi:MAG TPA: polymorphic toxin-type HINT domain-containing protein [Candidatus Bathyarchaeia archaeon]|nr:polymorphic toxin-type HINT domain-containing protein [Candidatus Bathyarchaeia archaeon]